MCRLSKELTASLILAGIVAILCSTSGIQACSWCVDWLPPLWDFPEFSEKTGTISPARGIWEEPETRIIVEDFEYTDGVGNHGWSISPPNNVIEIIDCPDWFSLLQPVFDHKLESFVLDFCRSPDDLQNKTCTGHCIAYNLATPPTPDMPSGVAYIDISVYPIVSFDFRSSQGTGIDVQEIFEFGILGTTGAGHEISVRIVPDPRDQPSEGTICDEIDTIWNDIGVVTDISTGSLQVTIYVDSAMMDSCWHTILVDVYAAVKDAVDGYEGIMDKADWYMTRAWTVSLSGVIFRLDRICFSSKRLSESFMNPDLFELGPLYAQISEPFRYLFMADYEVPQGLIKVSDLMLDSGNFLCVQNPDNPNDPVVRYWIDLGADPARFGKEADPVISGIMGREFIVDLSLPIFADPGLRLTKEGPSPQAKGIIDAGTLSWYVKAFGYGANDVTQSLHSHKLPVSPYDGMPTYLPAYYDAINLVKTLGKPSFKSDLVLMLEGALWNAGVTVWPNILALDFTHEYLEDIIVTMEVGNGIHWDVRTFPISVVNYPVENYPPVAQLPVKEQVFFIDRVNEYIVNFIDPDCFIFPLSVPSCTTHIPGLPLSESFRKDMETLYWLGNLDPICRFPSILPCQDRFFDSSTGLISMKPESKGGLYDYGTEGTYDFLITCTDSRGASEYIPSTRVNHDL